MSSMVSGTAEGESQQQRRLPLREATRNRILTEILGRAQKGSRTTTAAGEEKRKFAVVLDTRSTRVLSAALLSFDLGEQGVAIVENIHKSRQPFPALEAIYIVEPTVENLDRIERDFQFVDAPLYFRAHVFLTRKPASVADKAAVEGLYERLRGTSYSTKKGKKLASGDGKRPSRLLTLIEANIDFLAVEENAFHLDLPRALVQLFGPKDEQAVWCENRIVDGVASLCATLNEYPFIRYTANNALGESLARNLDERIDTLMRDDPDFWFHGKDSGARATLLFLDRRQDLAAPLLHEFTYQALVYDLLESRDNLIKYQQGSRSDEGGIKSKKALLNETDPLWVQFRHSHIANVIEQLTQITKELRETTVGQYLDQDGNAAAGVELDQMQAVVSELQAFKEVMAKHTMHLAICQACMDKVTKQNLIDTAKFEQSIVTGVDSEGERVSETKILNELAMLMRREEVDPKDKVRVAALHAVTLGQVSQETIQKFIRDSYPPLSTESQYALLGLASLGVSLIATAGGGGMGKPWFVSRKPKPLAGQELETPYRTPDAIARAQKVAQTTTMKMSRSSPLVKNHVESICANRMTLEAFPFVKPPPPNSGLGGSPIDMQEFRGAAHRVTTIDRSLSVRKHSSTTAAIEATRDKLLGGGKDALPEVLADANKIVYQGGRILVFVAGGCTYSEIRALSEVMRSTKREIIIGSTHFIKPGEFLQDLELLGDDEKAIKYLEEDQDVLMELKAKEFFMEGDEEENHLLDKVLIDGNINPEEIAKEEAEEQAKAVAEMEKNADLGVIPWLMGYIPFCGKSLRAWFNGDDVDLEDDEEDDEGIIGDIKTCCTCCFPNKNTNAPLAQQGAAV